MGKGSPRGRGPVIPCTAGAQQGLKGGGLGGGGWYPGELWDWLQARVQCGLVVGIQVVVDPATRPKGGYSSMVWVQWLEACVAEGLVSRCVWVWCGAVA
jgi:hypothetical protein